jgi:hypothetical protein
VELWMFKHFSLNIAEITEMFDLENNAPPREFTRFKALHQQC